MSILKPVKCILSIHNIRSFHNLSRNAKVKSVIASGSSFKYCSKDSQGQNCWKCGAAKRNCSDLFCSECNIIQKPLHSGNYFKLLNLDEKFDIDQTILRNEYRRLQSHLHPDKFTNRSDEEKEISADYSSLVNKAYNCLLTPLKRAEHLLRLYGNHINENQPLDSNFLMEMMELNEEAENTNDPEKLKGLNMKNKKEIDKLILSIEESFKQKDLEVVKQLIMKLQYYSSLGHRINRTLRELGIVD
ncbi:iron-sulfur cluster co-chaperone protein HscB-like protein, mitochondrial [Rhynchophorus ferrugineus]|uniref:iron-sulfur cluster co-chaperone protein HscB-like protein, mitochondrial n=1 Tax=Rhynchophorus ferrugineus TaxID=354439 RepID=UPI003FCDC05D